MSLAIPHMADDERNNRVRTLVPLYLTAELATLGFVGGRSVRTVGRFDSPSAQARQT